MNRISSLLRIAKWNLLFAAMASLLVAIPAVDAYGPRPSKTAQSDDAARSYAAASPSSALSIQKTRLNTDLPSKRHSINVNSSDITFALEPLESPGKTQAHQIGVGRGVAMPSPSIGKLFVNQDGSKVRLLVIRSSGAVGMRVHIERFDVAPGDEVYVYGAATDSYVGGPYSRQGPFGPEKGSSSGGAFWTDTFEGDTVIIEHYIAGEERDFYISEVSHLYKSIPGNDVAPNVLACHNDAMCFGDPEKDSVGRIVYVDDGSSFVCTGTMMNNQTSDFAPYFYTANHCVSTQTVAQTVETYWFYRTTSCNSGVVSAGWVRTTAGTSVLATQQTADSTLLRIFNSVPGLWFAGSDPNVKAIGTSVLGLSHPGGGLPFSTESYLRRASGSITSATSACAPSGLVNGYTADWTSGLVEPGSSGSGLFVTQGANNFFVGVLSCGLVTPFCADLALYGKYSDFFPTIQTYISLGDNTGVCAATPITVGQTINGSLAASDCKARVRGVNYNSDRYSFSGTAGDQISISMSSTSVDTYLNLLSPSKTLTAQNDDDGSGGTNSRIPAPSGVISLPSTGTYFIEATSFFTGEIGNYTLTLSGVVNNSISGTVSYFSDFDNDGRSDIGFYRAGLWGFLKSAQLYSLGSAQFFSWGGNGLRPICADYDGDGKGDIAFIVPPSGGQSAAYSILQSSTGYSFTPGDVLFFPAGFPVLGDTPIVGDFDGDGKADPGIWRSSQGVWIIPKSSTNYTSFIFSQWGQQGDIPVIADFDMDGKSDIGFYRNGLWGVLKSGQNFSLGSAQFFSWGGAGLQPLTGDFDGDGKADIGHIVPPSGGQSAAYAILKSSTGYSFLPGDVLFVPAGFPVLGDTPVVGKFDGDGKDDPGIWRESQGVWIISLSASNYTTFIFSQWGQSGDIPFPNSTGKH